jgi:hypothetical protein
VIGRPDNADAGDRAAGHSGATVEQGDHPPLAGAIGRQELQEQEREFGRANDDDVLGALVYMRHLGAVLALLQADKCPQGYETSVQDQRMDDRYGTGNVVETREAEQHNASHQLRQDNGSH